MIEIDIDEIFQLNQQKLDTQFEYIKLLSRGSFGIVNLFYDKDNQREVAIKEVSKDNENEYIIVQFRKEINFLKKVSHQNIVTLYDFFETTKNAYIIMEYIKGGTLAELMTMKNKAIQESDILIIIKYLLIAVAHLHKIGICHRDIKLENIMFDSFNDLSSLKVIDFGLSTDLCDFPSKIAGTILYMAPERLLKQHYSNNIDIWSIGILTYILIHKGQHPFLIDNGGSVTNKDDYVRCIFNNPIRTILFHSDASLFAKDFIQKLIEIKPSVRYSAKYALHHIWLTKDYTKMYSHISENDINNFKNKEVYVFYAMIFLSQYMQTKQNQVETNYLETIDNNNNTLVPEPQSGVFASNKRRLKSFGNKKNLNIRIDIITRPGEKSSLAVCNLNSFYNKPSFSDKDCNTTKSSIDIQTETYNQTVTVPLTKLKVVTPKQKRFKPMLFDNITTTAIIPLGTKSKSKSSFTLMNKPNLAIKAIPSKFKKVDIIKRNSNCMSIQANSRKTLVLPRIVSSVKKK